MAPLLFAVHEGCARHIALFLFVMVASANSDLYSPFQRGMNTEEGQQSSEDGSGVHSPVFGAPFPSPHGDNCELFPSSDGRYSDLSLNKVRYQHDQLNGQHATAILAPQYDYGTALHSQQAPLLDTTLELSSSSTSTATFPSQFPVPLPTRNHIGHDFAVQPLGSSRMSSVHGGGPIDLRYTASSERGFPDGSSHDHAYSRHAADAPGMSMDNDRRPASVPASEPNEPATSIGNSPRQSRKEVSTTVIACRQWYVLLPYRSYLPLAESMI